MNPDLRVTAELDPLLVELKKLEPLYHAAAAEASVEQFETLVAPDFWEIGASGRRYSRDFALQALKGRAEPPTPEQWQTSEYHLAVIGPETFLLTYTLTQPGRVTLRSSLWQQLGHCWQVRFHQGTVVS